MRKVILRGVRNDGVSVVMLSVRLKETIRYISFSHGTTTNLRTIPVAVGDLKSYNSAMRRFHILMNTKSNNPIKMIEHDTKRNSTKSPGSRQSKA